MATPLFDEIYAVGDSLSDSGLLPDEPVMVVSDGLPAEPATELSRQAISLAAPFVDTEGLQPIPVSPPYYFGRFSNGPVLPEITADLLGAKLINFSFGGAQALGTLTLLDAADGAIPEQVKLAIAALPSNNEYKAPLEAVLNHDINLSSQVADLVAETSAHPPSANSALVSMIGLNDLQSLISHIDFDNPPPLQAVLGEALQTAGDIVQAIPDVAAKALPLVEGPRPLDSSRGGMPTASPLFDEIYAVGDSMSDSGLLPAQPVMVVSDSEPPATVGRIYELSSQALSLAHLAGLDTDGLQPIPVSPPYYFGRFSNGPVLPEITADLLGAKLINFSFGGAQALGTLTLRQAAQGSIPFQELIEAVDALPSYNQYKAPLEAVLNHDINLSSQVADLVAETSAHPPSANSALVSMIGLNDLQSLIGSVDAGNPQALLGEALQTAGGIVQANLGAANTAFDQGIGTVIFETLPSPSFFPIGSALPSELQAIGDAAVDVVNLGLKADALALRLQGHDARVVDLARMADEISADPGTFGFQNLDQPTLVPPSAGGDPNQVPFGNFVLNPAAPPIDQTAFFDPLHATTKLHGVLAAFTAASLTSHTDFRGAGNDFIIGSPGDDLVLAGAGNDQALLGGGNDIAFGGLGDDVIDGGPGNDIIAGGAGNDRLSGGPGSDVLAGGAGNDVLDGGAGNDVLIDGLGSNTLSGGAGDDLFLYTEPQLLGGSGTDAGRIDGGSGFDTLALRLNPNALASEQANVDANFVPGQPFAFSSMDLKITGIEQIVLSTQASFADVKLPSGDLGERLHQANLFGVV